MPADFEYVFRVLSDNQIVVGAGFLLLADVGVTAAHNVTGYLRNSKLNLQKMDGTLFTGWLIEDPDIEADVAFFRFEEQSPEVSIAADPTEARVEIGSTDVGGARKLDGFGA